MRAGFDSRDVTPEGLSQAAETGRDGSANVRVAIDLSVRRCIEGVQLSRRNACHLSASID
jgi:hypothetical protein